MNFRSDLGEVNQLSEQRPESQAEKEARERADQLERDQRERNPVEDDEEDDDAVPE